MTIIYKPKTGHTRNPMRRVGRNVTCFCSSGKKVKKCCGVPLYVEEEWAAKVNELLNKLDDAAKKAIGYK